MNRWARGLYREIEAAWDHTVDTLLRLRALLRKSLSE